MLAPQPKLNLAFDSVFETQIFIKFVSELSRDICRHVDPTAAAAARANS